MSSPQSSYSPVRIWARRIVWAVFLVVLTVRYFHKPEPMPRPPVFNPEFANQGGRPTGPAFRGGRRSSPPVPKPNAPMPTNVWRIELEFSPADAQAMRGYMWSGWNRGGAPTQERPEASITVREGGKTYTKVAVHLKGSAGSFRHFDDRPALTLNFSKHNPGQKFHGWSKLSLNNSVQDSSYVCEALGRELFTAAGVPAPKASHATVVLDGRDLGLYVVTEGWGKPFLKQHFEKTGGNLYDGGFVQDVDGAVSVASGDHPEDHSSIERLAQAAQEGDRAARWKALERVLDMDRFITLLAMDTLVCNWDGYGINRNNYRVFHDLATDKMVFMPHGLDQLFGGGRRMGPDSSLNPPMRGLVARAVMSTAEGRKRYQARIPELLAKHFDETKLQARVREMAEQIRPTLAAYSPSLASQHDAEIEDLLLRIHDRIESVKRQLAEPQPTLVFDTNGVYKPKNWQPRSGQQGVGTTVFGSRQEDGRTYLTIAAKDGLANGSFRSRVQLGPGHYRFQSKAKILGGESNAGISLRVSGARMPFRPMQGSDWNLFQFSFALEEETAEIELVAEFIAGFGEAVFDLDSMVLVKE